MALSYTGKSKVIRRIVEALRPASRSSLGLVKAGSGIDISDDGTISSSSGTLTQDGVEVEDGGLLTKAVGEDGTVTLGFTERPASPTSLGLVKVGDGISVADDGTISAKAGGSVGTVSVSGDEYGIIGATTAEDGSVTVSHATYGFESLGSDGQMPKMWLPVPTSWESGSDGSLSLSCALMPTDGPHLSAEGLSGGGSPERNGIRVPTATASSAGVVRVGDGLSIDKNGVLSASGGGGASGSASGTFLAVSSIGYSSGESPHLVVSCTPVTYEDGAVTGASGQTTDLRVPAATSGTPGVVRIAPKRGLVGLTVSDGTLSHDSGRNVDGSGNESSVESYVICGSASDAVKADERLVTIALTNETVSGPHVYRFGDVGGTTLYFPNATQDRAGTIDARSYSVVDMMRSSGAYQRRDADSGGVTARFGAQTTVASMTLGPGTWYVRGSVSYESDDVDSLTLRLVGQDGKSVAERKSIAAYTSTSDSIDGRVTLDAASSVSLTAEPTLRSGHTADSMAFKGGPTRIEALKL